MTLNRLLELIGLTVEEYDEKIKISNNSKYVERLDDEKDNKKV